MIDYEHLLLQVKTRWQSTEKSCALKFRGDLDPKPSGAVKSVGLRHLTELLWVFPPYVKHYS